MFIYLLGFNAARNKRNRKAHFFNYKAYSMSAKMTSERPLKAQKRQHLNQHIEQQQRKKKKI